MLEIAINKRPNALACVYLVVSQKSLTSTDGHTGKCEAMYNSMETKKSFNELFVIC